MDNQTVVVFNKKTKDILVFRYQEEIVFAEKM